MTWLAVNVWPPQTSEANLPALRTASRAYQRQSPWHHASQNTSTTPMATHVVCTQHHTTGWFADSATWPVGKHHFAVPGHAHSLHSLKPAKGCVIGTVPSIQLDSDLGIAKRSFVSQADAGECRVRIRSSGPSINEVQTLETLERA